MLLTREEVINITEQKLFERLSPEQKEGTQLEYKISVSEGGSKDWKREFLKDITGFANAEGGVIIYGVKEPALDSPPVIVGLPDYEEKAKSMERLAAALTDPRIPGLLIQPLKIENRDGVIIIYIPPSFQKPHAAVHDNKRSYYKRHTESHQPMTTYELRESVLSSVNAEEKALQYLSNQEIDIINYTLEDDPAYFMQATPLVRIENIWNLISKSGYRILTGDDRRDWPVDYFYSIVGAAPSPSINGITGSLTGRDRFLIDIHRNGHIQLYIQCGYFAKEIIRVHKYFFDSFADICERAITTFDSDIPYLLKCKYFNAKDVNFVFGSRGFRQNKYKKNEISWPITYRQTGERFLLTTDSWWEQLNNAFGFTNKEIK